jgi:glycosylphosphatidylinositol transamidase
MQYSGLPMVIHDDGKEKQYYSDWIENYPIMMWNLISFIRHQTTGFPTRPHALFTKYNIEALSLHGIPGSRVGLSNIGLGLETSVRSLNNLLERFHHAYWYYLMPTAHSFIPISKYIGPIAITAACSIFVSLDVWWTHGEIPVRNSGSKQPWKYALRGYGVSTFTNRVRPIYIPTILLGLCFLLPIWVWNQIDMILSMAKLGVEHVDFINTGNVCSALDLGWPTNYVVVLDSYHAKNVVQ